LLLLLPFSSSFFLIISGGSAFHATQKLPQGLTIEDKPSRVTLVFFVGGCTFTEISAIRFLNNKYPGKRLT
jgi:hypothetical protein